MNFHIYSFLADLLLYRNFGTYSWQVCKSKAAYAAGIHKENELYREEQQRKIRKPVPIWYNVVKMIEKHEDNILNYFQKKQTNAKTENMNGKIQRFIANNFGVRDKDFTLYRIADYF